VIFAVLDVSLAINLCINCSFFAVILHNSLFRTTAANIIALFYHNRARSPTYQVVLIDSAKSPQFTPARHRRQTDRQTENISIAERTT